jgi:hypothetical protein
MSNPNNNSDSFYTPPTTPSGDRDWRREVNDWMRQRNNGAQPIDLNTMVVIDNLLDALDESRAATAAVRAQCDLALKRQAELESAMRAMAKIADDARSPGAWRWIGNPSDRIP